MEISDELKNFINENIDLINENTKESWEQIYNKIKLQIISEFTKTILDARINDPAEILGYIPAAYLYESNIANYKIPGNVTSIGDRAFYNCDSLAEIVIPDSVTVIDQWAFYDCHNLTSVTIGDSVISIGDNAFLGCSSLKSVVIPDSITSIGRYAFEYCSNLTSVIIPYNVMSISNFAFAYCTSLKEINFKGTKKQAIQLGIGDRSKREWRKKSPIKKIICTDGIIEL